MKALDLKGKRYGKLVAIEPVYINNIRMWKCNCDCGNSINVTTSQLRAGNKKTCGCRTQDTINNYVGRKYGNLTVIEFDSKDKENRNLYKCKCDCGNTIITSAKNLERGVTNNCGCKTKEKRGRASRLKYGEAARNRVLSTYKHNAKNKNLDFTLTNEEMFELFKGKCHYCGEKPSKVYSNEKFYGEFIYNGIDRLDSSKGYIKGNVVSCCSVCNYLKSDYTEEEFINIIRKIAKHRKL